MYYTTTSNSATFTDNAASLDEITVNNKQVANKVHAFVDWSHKLWKGTRFLAGGDYTYSETRNTLRNQVVEDGDNETKSTSHEHIANFGM